MKYDIVRIDMKPELAEKAAGWFHEKWNIDKELYLESINDSLYKSVPFPKWYLILDGETIIAGAGVIKNDFHTRKELMPNVCAVYVEEEYRGRGIAGELLQVICLDMASRGIYDLYLITEHEGFYERYGWKFVTVIKDDEGQDIRLYSHKINEKDYIVI